MEVPTTGQSALSLQIRHYQSWVYYYVDRILFKKQQHGVKFLDKKEEIIRIQYEQVKIQRRNPDFSSKCRHSSTVSPLPQAWVFEVLLLWAGNFTPQKKPADTQNWLLEQASTPLARWNHSPPGTSYPHFTKTFSISTSKGNSKYQKISHYTQTRTAGSQQALITLLKRNPSDIPSQDYKYPVDGWIDR